MQTATATFQDIFEDIHVLAKTIGDAAQKEEISRDIDNEEQEFEGKYGEQDGRDTVNVLLRFVVRIQTLIPRADAEAKGVAAFMVSFCEQMRNVFNGHRPYTSKIKSLLKTYYSTVPRALLLAKLKRLGEW